MHRSFALPARDVARLADPAFELMDGRDLAGTDPFILVAEDVMPHGAFGRCAYRGTETVTLVLEGAVERFDGVGNEGLIEAGDAQGRTAGLRVIHDESAVPGSMARTLQLWVQPVGRRAVDPPKASASAPPS